MTLPGIIKIMYAEVGFARQTTRVQYATLVAMALVLLAAVFRPAFAEAEFAFDTKWGEHGNSDDEFRSPAGVAVDSTGNVYVAEIENRRIQKFDEVGTFQLMWGWRVQNYDEGSYVFQICFSNCVNGSAGNGDGQFNSPAGVAVDSGGYVYVTDLIVDRIQKFRPVFGEYEYNTQWNGTEEGDALAGPDGVAVDSDGFIYVADTENDRIKRYRPADDEHVYDLQWDGGVGDGALAMPRGVAVDSADYVYVADTNNNRIQKFDVNGTPLKKWGSFCDVAEQGSEACEGEFNAPTGIAVDLVGNVYVADTFNHRIQVFDSNGDFIEKWGELCKVVDQDPEIPTACDGAFYRPRGIAVDLAGSAYVADTLNNRIQKFSQPSDEPESEPEQPGLEPELPLTPPPSLSPPTFVATPPVGETYESACNLKITSLRMKIGKSKSAKLSARYARRLFTRGFKGYIKWGTLAGNKVICKSLKMAVLQKRGKRYYVPGTKTRVSSKYLSANGLSAKGARFLRKKKVGKLTQKRVSKKRRTDISFKEFNSRSKLGKKALRSLKKKRYRGTYVLLYTAKVGKTTVSKKLTLKMSGKK